MSSLEERAADRGGRRGGTPGVKPKCENGGCDVPRTFFSMAHKGDRCCSQQCEQEFRAWGGDWSA